MEVVNLFSDVNNKRAELTKADRLLAELVEIIHIREASEREKQLDKLLIMVMAYVATIN